MRRMLLGALRLIPVLAAASALQMAAAEGFPDKPIKWIVAYPPGGGSDVVARTVAASMGEALGQTIVVDNRPGAATRIAVSALLQSKPDGYTVMTGENASMMWNEYMFSNLGYNPRKDFTYIGAIGRFPVALVVNPAFPAQTLGEFIDYVRKNPGKVNYASPGSGTPHHLAMELFKQRANLNLVHVPYKGSAPAMQDVMANQVPVQILDLASGLPVIRSGKLRALAVAMPERSNALPDVPTFKEAGLAVDAYAMFGLIGPAGIPREAVTKLNAALNKALADPKTVKLFTDTAAEAAPGSPEAFEREVSAERERWAPVIKAGAIRMD